MASGLFTRIVQAIFGKKEQPKGQELGTTDTIYEEEIQDSEVHSIWDYLEFQPNTQADHVTKVVGFDEWVDMDEIRRRILEIFGITYKNEKSLYPYIKTLVDCSLLEISNIGGRRKWRKKELLITIKKKKKAQKEEVLAQTG